MCSKAAKPYTFICVQVLAPMLCKHKALLPRTQFKTICMKAMHVFHASVEELKPQVERKASHATYYPSDRAPEAKEAFTRAPVATSEHMRWEDLEQAILVMHQQMLCTIHDALVERPAPTQVQFPCNVTV